MAPKTKVCLAIAIVFLIAGTVMSWGPYSHRVPPSLHVVLPLGAIFLGLFLISRLFAKEEKVYADDQKHVAAKAGLDSKDSRG